MSVLLTLLTHGQTLPCEGCAHEARLFEEELARMPRWMRRLARRRKAWVEPAQHDHPPPPSGPVRVLDAAARACVEATLRDLAAEHGWELHELRVDEDRADLLVTPTRWELPTSACWAVTTERLVAAGLARPDEPVWAEDHRCLLLEPGYLAWAISFIHAGGRGNAFESMLLAQERPRASA